MTLEELGKRMNAYAEKGLLNEVIQATREAGVKTRLFIARTHPRTAFDGKALTPGMFVRGSFTIGEDETVQTIYANYFARWYNTGAYGRVIRYGKRKGQKGPSYGPRGHYFESNKAAIEEYYAACIDTYLNQHAPF